HARSRWGIGNSPRFDRRCVATGMGGCRHCSGARARLRARFRSRRRGGQKPACGHPRADRPRRCRGGGPRLLCPPPALWPPAGRVLGAEQRALDPRAFELGPRAFMRGWALGCLDAIAGETVEGACEKALFASPEASAAAVSYVAAQLSLLASARELGRHGGAASGILALRHPLEADRSSIVAHVLATRAGSAPGH